MAMGCSLLDQLRHRSYEEGDVHVVELDVTDDIRGPGGSVHGGVVAALIDRAAAYVATRTSGRLVATANATVHYVSPGRVGPLRAEAEEVRTGRAHGVVGVRVLDAGKQGRLVATALLGFGFLDGDTFDARTT